MVASAPTSANNSHQPPLPSESNHSDAKSVNKAASTSRHLGSDTSTAPDRRGSPGGFDTAATSDGIAYVASTNQTATGSHASISRPSVTSCRAAPATRI